jgi:hypothetical protein
MKGRKRYWLERIAILVAYVLTSPVACGSAAWILEVRGAGGEGAFFSKEAEAGERFALQHVHSLTNRPIEEIYELDIERGVVLQEVIFDSTGLGAPDIKAGDQWRIVDGKYHIYNMNRQIGILRLRVSYLNDQVLKPRDHPAVSLRSLGSPGDLLEIQFTETR